MDDVERTEGKYFPLRSSPHIHFHVPLGKKSGNREGNADPHSIFVERWMNMTGTARVNMTRVAPS